MTHFLEIILIKRWLFCCLFFLVAACSHRNENQINDFEKIKLINQEQRYNRDLRTIVQAEKNVKQGDLILRTGRDFTSDIMRRVSTKDKTYSHCGLASFEHDTLFVYHAIGGEWNPDQKLRRDPFELFCNPYESKGFGIYRYQLNRNEQLQIVNLIRNSYIKGIMFDMQFNLDSNDRMYCSEFVYKTIERATGYEIKIPVDTFNSLKFVAVDNLFINPFCKEVKRVKFQTE